MSKRLLHDYEEYKQRLSTNSSDEEIIWVYLSALYDDQKELGIYYVLPEQMREAPRIMRLIKRIKSLGLATQTGEEGGNSNIWMKVTAKGDFAVSTFGSLNQYLEHLEKEREKRQNAMTINSHNAIVNSTISSSTVSQGDHSNFFKKDENSIPSTKESKHKPVTIDTIARIVAGLGSIAALIVGILKMTGRI